MRSRANLEQILIVAQMQAAERQLIDGGTSVDELMQRAGSGAAEWVWRMSGGRPVTVLCGPGNNGGDGYVIAAEILQRGGEAKVVAPLSPGTAVAQSAAAHFQAISGNQRILTDANKVHGEVLVDCLFGSGLSRPLSSEFRALIAELQASHTHSVAIDVPSGVDADTGSWPDGISPFDATLALGAWKRAHWTGEASAKSGAKRLVDIGVTDQGGAEQLSSKPRLSAPAWNAHKYRRGLVAVVGGVMPGAAVLAAKASQGAGVGYVKLLEQDTADCPPVIVCDPQPLAEALSDKRIGAVLVGPGLGRSADAREVLQSVLATSHRVVIDADALHLVEPQMLQAGKSAPCVLTPHEGELASLCDTFGIAEASKRARAQALAERTGAAVVAKGPDTILACRGEVTYFPQGPSWLSVAGSGDVLAGVIAARLAGGTDPAQAASEGIWLHNEAARQAGIAFSASDLAHCVASAYATFL